MTKVVLCNGVFDLLHYGHHCHLRAAKKLGTFIVVGVTRDRSVNKGPGQPVFNEQQRAEMLQNLKFVHSTLLVDSSLEALQKIKPDVFVKGKEYEGKLRDEDLAYCKENGIEIVFTDEPVWSSTKLIRDHVRTVGG